MGIREVKGLPVVQLYRHSFPSFVRFVFNELHPNSDFIDNWHIELICDRLMQCQAGNIRRLVINLPPRYLKSLITSVAWPLFLCAHKPGIRISICTGNFDLAIDLDEQRRRLIGSDRLLQIFPNLRVQDARGRTRFANGSEIVQSVVGRSQMGRGADIFIIDDPQSAADAASEKRREKLAEWFGKEVVRALNKKESASIVVVMQRLHDKDFCATLNSESGKWERLVLPGIVKADERWTLSDGRVFHRKPFQVLAPGQESREVLHGILRQIRGQAFYAQYLQKPTLYHSFRPSRRKSFVYDGWTPEQGMLSERLFVDLTHDIERDYFGLIDPRFNRPGLRQATRGEWEAAFKHQQLKLYAEMAETAKAGS